MGEEALNGTPIAYQAKAISHMKVYSIGLQAFDNVLTYPLRKFLLQQVEKRTSDINYRQYKQSETLQQATEFTKKPARQKDEILDPEPLSVFIPKLKIANLLEQTRHRLKATIKRDLTPEDLSRQKVKKVVHTHQ